MVTSPSSSQRKTQRSAVKIGDTGKFRKMPVQVVEHANAENQCIFC